MTSVASAAKAGSAATKKKVKVGVQLKVKLDEGVETPEFHTEGAACFDLAAKTNHRVCATPVLVGTGVSVEIPPGYCMQISLRSSMVLKGWTIPNAPCIIDSDYRGEILVPLMRPWGIAADSTIVKGTRFAQARLVRLVETDIQVVDKLNPSPRGLGGFGSTGDK